jgi:hypothetical protein
MVDHLVHIIDNPSLPTSAAQALFDNLTRPVAQVPCVKQNVADTCPDTCM